MMNLKTKVTVLCLAVSVVSTFSAQAKSVARRSERASFGTQLNDNSALKLKQVVDSMTNESVYNIPGISISVLPRNGKIWSYASGVSNLDQQRPMASEMRFRVGSITKTFTGYLIMVLAQKGYFKVDSALQDLLPDLKQKLPKIDFARITVRNLLNHTSGIPTYTALNKGIFQSCLEAPRTIWSQDAILNILASESPASKPGEKFDYSNSNYYLLGMIIERVTGLSYESAIERYLLSPLGLGETIVPRPGEADLPFGSSHGYIGTSNQDPSLRDFSAVDPSVPWSAGSMISTTPDLAKFTIALQERRLLYGEFRDELFLPVDGMPGYSYGVGIIKNDNDRTIGHYGEIFGFECSMRYLLNRNLAVSACVNRSLFDSTLPTNSNIDGVLMEKLVKILNANTAIEIQGN